MATPTIPAILYTDRASVRGLLSEQGVDLRLDDNDSGYVSADELSRLDECISLATARVNAIAVSIYEPVVLANNFVIWDWATILAAVCVCRRRNHGPDGYLKEEYERVQDELKALRTGEFVISDLPIRDTTAPSVDNFRLDGNYHTRQLRVLPSISDPTQAKHQRFNDFISLRIPERRV